MACRYFHYQSEHLPRIPSELLSFLLKQLDQSSFKTWKLHYHFRIFFLRLSAFHSYLFFPANRILRSSGNTSLFLPSTLSNIFVAVALDPSQSCPHAVALGRCLRLVSTVFECPRRFRSLRSFQIYTGWCLGDLPAPWNHQYLLWMIVRYWGREGRFLYAMTTSFIGDLWPIWIHQLKKLLARIQTYSEPQTLSIRPEISGTSKSISRQTFWESRNYTTFLSNCQVFNSVRATKLSDCFWT